MNGLMVDCCYDRAVKFLRDEEDVVRVVAVRLVSECGQTFEVEEEDNHRTLHSWHKCSSCYKRYNKKEHLIEHLRVSYHSVHDPTCVICKKHCKSLESVREHLTGPLRKGYCGNIFSTYGCDICLKIFDGADALRVHKNSCYLVPSLSPKLVIMPIVDEYAMLDMELFNLIVENNNVQGTKVVAMDCEMVGGGSDGSLDLCAWVCLLDEDENVIFHSYVQPQIPVTNYRHEITGITKDHLVHANPLFHVSRKIQEILYNGEPPWRSRMEGGKARILVGHSLEHDLYCLQMDYPDHLIREHIEIPSFDEDQFDQPLIEVSHKNLLGVCDTGRPPQSLRRLCCCVEALQENALPDTPNWWFINLRRQ